MKNFKVIGALVAAIIVVTMIVFVQHSVNAAIDGTAHDFQDASNWTTGAAGGNQICSPCHTPHQPAAMNGQDPLWSHNLSAQASYGVYANAATLNATPADVGGAAVGSASVTNLCLSCHDGTIGMDMYDGGAGANTPLMGAINGGASNVGTSLADDHPVNFTYDNALFVADGELIDPAGAAVAALLNAGTVQCSSCHDPHGKAGVTKLLQMDNTGSALCLTCHNK